MTHNLELFGTDQPPVERRGFSNPPWTFFLENAAVRHITLNGFEAIRGIAFLVRDRDWGTLVPLISNEVIEQNDTNLHVSFDAKFENQGACLEVSIAIEVNVDSLVMKASGRSRGAFETNRAGFTVLHPINDVAGHPVRVAHGDGSIDNSNFPALIEPWQPFMDITALTHRVGSNSVSCVFKGDTFEMEDQRQWGDASFKTYNRPLAKPWPYVVEDGEALEQSVTLTWTKAANADVAVSKPTVVEAIFPESALVITPADARRLAENKGDLSYVNPQRLLCHLDVCLGDTNGQFDAFAKAQNACSEVKFDLELICRFDADPAAELVMLAAQMEDAGFLPASIMICPSVDRQSTPPGSDWPTCPPLEQIHQAAALVFPDIERGGGMVSFFPELNRKRPPVDMLGFVSHGLCPIVHAADDISVMETLETIPHIVRSTRAIIGDKPYRIGPATIAMRQNPYGNRTIPNPENERICMVDDDPRHRAKFGAAYAIGLATALASANISIWTPAALYGPRGVLPDKGNWPIADALKQLSSLAKQRVHKASIESGLARLWVGDTELTANLSHNDAASLSAFEWRAGSPRS